MIIVSLKHMTIPVGGMWLGQSSRSKHGKYGNSFSAAWCGARYGIGRHLRDCGSFVRKTEFLKALVEKL